MRHTIRVVTVALIVTTSALAGGPIPISQPGTITESGDYVVTQDLTVQNGAVLTIEAADVTIDLDGHRLTSGGDVVVFLPEIDFTQNFTMFDGELFGGATGFSKDGGNDSFPGNVVLDNLLIQDCALGVGQEDGTIQVRNSVVRCTEALRLSWADAAIQGTIANNELIGDVTVNRGQELHFRDNRISGTFFIETDGYESSTIEDNVIAGGFGGPCQEMTISRNVLAGSGLFVAFGEGNVIEHNSLLGARMIVFPFGNIVRNNMIVGAPGDGLEIQDENMAARNTIVDSSGVGLVLLGDDVQYGGNYSRGNAGGDFEDDGNGNVSRGGNYLPDAQ